MPRKSTKVVDYEVGSGNVYADLGYPDSEAMLVKSRLVAKIAEIIRKRGLTQVEAAARLGRTQNQSRRISIERDLQVSEHCFLQATDSFFGRTSQGHQA